MLDGHAGTTPLYWAANKGVVKTAADGANPNQAAADDGGPPINVAARKGRTAVAKTLLEHKADPNQACTDDGALPLYSALENGYVDIANVLLEPNAEPNKAKFDGKTRLDKKTPNKGSPLVQGGLQRPSRRGQQQRRQQQQQHAPI